MSSCWSIGRSSSRSLYFLKLPQNQWGKAVLILATVSPKQRRLMASAAFAGVVGNDDGETGVAAPAQRGGLSQTRMAEHGRALGVDSRVGFEVVEGPAQTPGPGIIEPHSSAAGRVWPGL